MANVNNPHGLIYLGFCLGGGPGTVEPFDKDASEGTAIFPGDAVNQEADGNIEAASATPGSTLYSGVSLNYGAASALTNHIVIVSPDAIFEAQGDNAGGSDTLNADDAGLNANLILGAGVVATLKSGHQIDASTKQTTNSLDVKLRRLYSSPENVSGAYGRFEIMFNNHRNAYGTTAV